MKTFVNGALLVLLFPLVLIGTLACVAYTGVRLGWEIGADSLKWIVK